MKNILLTLVAITAGVCAFGVVAFAQVTVIKAGRLIDPDSGTVLTDQKIVIGGNKIAAIGKELHIPGDAKWIDLSGYDSAARLDRLPHSFGGRQ